jgi:hypothetical protein
MGRSSSRFRASLEHGEQPHGQCKYYFDRDLEHDCLFNGQTVMPGASDPELDFRRRFQETTAFVSATETKAQDEIKTFGRTIPIANARYYLACWVVLTFLGYVVAVGLYVMFWPELDRIALLMDIMKTLLLPLVTLAIGFYFGSAKSD